VHWSMSWTPSLDRRQARESWDWRFTVPVGHIVMTMRAWPAAHRGTLTFTERFREPSGYSFTCASGPVAFRWPTNPVS
jgi:hypothetical protein